MTRRRKDSRGRILQTGESQRPNGTYSYRWTNRFGERQNVYAPTLNELRIQKERIKQREKDGLLIRADNLTVNDIYDVWKKVKKGVKDNTLQNYKYMYEKFVMDDIGKYQLSNLRKLDIRIYYNDLVDNRGFKIKTLDNIHTVLYQVLELAVEEDYIRANPSSNALNELKRTHRLNMHLDKRRALTLEEQELFLNFLDKDIYGRSGWATL